MPTPTTTITIRRNTAMTLESVIQQPLEALVPDAVPIGAKLYGFDPTDPKHEAWTFDAEEDATRDGMQHIAEPFQLVAWLAKKCLVFSESVNGMVPAVRLVLIDKDGETLAFTSSVVLGTMDLIRAHRGDGPYNPPIPVIVSFVKNRFGGNSPKLRIYKERSKKPESK